MIVVKEKSKTKAKTLVNDGLCGLMIVVKEKTKTKAKRLINDGLCGPFNLHYNTYSTCSSIQSENVWNDESSKLQNVVRTRTHHVVYLK